MKGLILAAGFGKRLQPLTNKIPKSMVEINGEPLLVHTLNILSGCGIKEIGIVVGHLADYIKERIGYSWNGVQIKYFENEEYETTNNVFSMYKAMSFFDDDVILSECDIYYKRDLIEKVVADDSECSIVVSPFNPDTMDGTVIRVFKNKAIELILGKWQGADFNYADCQKTVNVYKFSKGFIQEKFAPLLKWYVEKMGKNSYYEKILGSLIYYKECNINVVSVPETAWCEIDNLEDLEKARNYFKD